MLTSRHCLSLLIQKQRMNTCNQKTQNIVTRKYGSVNPVKIRDNVHFKFIFDPLLSNQEKSSFSVERVKGYLLLKNLLGILMSTFQECAWANASFLNSLERTLKPAIDGRFVRANNGQSVRENNEIIQAKVGGDRRYLLLWFTKLNLNI